MSKILDKGTVARIVEFLKYKQNMPHIVSVWCLRKMDINVSVRTIINIRNKYELLYVQDKQVHNAVQQARDKGIDITHEFLKIRLPQIGQEHREYLVAFHAKRLRNELPPMHVRSPELMLMQLTCR